MTKARTSDPRRLDIEALAQAGEERSGSWPLATFQRLASATLPSPADAPDAVAWRASGQLAPLGGAGKQPALALEADAEVTLECQRCLQPLRWPLHVQRRLFFVDGEAAAEALDAESDDDVLARPPSLDLHSLVEDELILALPIVPRHEICPVPLAAPTEDDAAAREESPFAALAALKRGTRPN